MPSVGTLGGTLPWGPKSLKVKCQAFLQDGSTVLNWPATSTPSVTDNHHGAGAKGVTGCGRQVQEFLRWHRGYLFCPDLLLWRLLLQSLYYFGCYRKNNYKIIHPSTSLLLWWTNIFPPVSGDPWVSYSLIGKKYIPVFKILQLLQSW